MVRMVATLVVGLALGFAAGRFLPVGEMQSRPRYVGGPAAAGAVPDPAPPADVKAASVPDATVQPASQPPSQPPRPESDDGAIPVAAPSVPVAATDPGTPATTPADPVTESRPQETSSPAAEADASPDKLARAFPGGRGGRRARGERVPPGVVPRGAAPSGPGQAQSDLQAAEGSEETKPAGPFAIPEQQLRAIRELRARHEAAAEEKLAPIREKFQAAREEAAAAQEEAQRAMDEELRASMSAEEFARYKAEEENGRLDEAMQALDMMDRGFLGIYFDAERIDENAIGVRITDIQQGSAADYAGVRTGEVIVGLNGKPIAGWRDFRTGVRGTPPGTPLVLRLYDPETRGTREVTVVLGDAGREALRRLYEGEE